MFGLTAKAAVGILAINSIASLCYTGTVVWAGLRYEDAQLMDKFVADMAQAHWSVWLWGIGFFVAVGNFIPGLWLLLFFRDAPERPRAAQVAIVSTTSAAIAGEGHFLLFRAYANPVPQPDAVNLALSLLSWFGL